MGLVVGFAVRVGSGDEGDTVEPMRFLGFALLVFTMLAGSLFVSAAAAQDGPTILPVPQSESETQGTPGIDYDANQAGINRARRTLIAIAVVMSLGLLGYWWHTVPSRRLRVATKRLAQHRATISPVADDTESQAPQLDTKSKSIEADSGPV